MEDLRRHERRSSDDVRVGAEWRERAEVEEASRAVDRQADIARTHVAMHETLRVQKRERRRDVAKMATYVRVRQATELAEVTAFEELHRVVGTLGGDAVVVDFDDAWVFQPYESAVFALEQRGHRRRSFPRLRREQLLERDDSSRNVVECSVHDAGAARAEPVRQRVATRNSGGFVRASCVGGQVASPRASRSRRARI